MAIAYTTIDEIMRRLTGRLTLSAPSVLGHQQIDSALLLQLAEQAEARLNSALREVYNLPIQGQHPILSEYVQLRTICMLIPVYFQRQTPTDDRGIGDNSCREAEKLLDTLCTGKITLDGEGRRYPDESLDGIPAATTRVQARKPGIAEAIDF